MDMPTSQLPFAEPEAGAYVVVEGLHQPSGVSGEFNALYFPGEGYVLEASFYSPEGRTYILPRRWRYLKESLWFRPANG